MTPQNGGVAARAHAILNFANPLKKSETRVNNFNCTAPIVEEIKPEKSNRKLRKCRDSYDFYYASKKKLERQDSEKQLDVESAQLDVDLPLEDVPKVKTPEKAPEADARISRENSDRRNGQPSCMTTQRYL